MSSDVPAWGPAGPYNPVDQWWPTPAGPDGAPPVLDLRFDAGTLQALRTKVRACALRAGFAESRVQDVVLAVHELAANSVCHGGGAGRLRVWKLAGSLLCQVDDGDLLRAAEAGDGHARPGYLSDRMLVDSLPCVRGHGLHLVRQVADQMQSLSGSHGTRVRIAFALPSDVPPGQA